MGSDETLRIRTLRDEDIAALAAIEQESFSMPWSEEDFRNLLGETDALYLVAERDGKVLGSAGMRVVIDEGYIDNVVVAPAERGKGIGAALMGAVLEEGTGLGARAFTLEVRVGNKAAIGLYEKMGFVSEGIRPGFYDKPKEDAMIMWRR